MADSDLIARLYPFGDSDDGWEWSTKVVKELNPSRCAGSTHKPPPEVPFDPHNRQATVLPDQPSDLPAHLELRFSKSPRTTKGIVLGKDPSTSDIVLVNQQGISRQHCAITFENDFSDSSYRLVVRDLRSTCGTAVAYDGQGGMKDGGVRRDFRWVLSGYDVPNSTKMAIIELHKNLKFQIVVSRHDIASQLYMSNVAAFFNGTTSMDDLFSSLGLPSRPQTEPVTGVQKPDIIYLKKRLGKGSFGAVTHFWNVSDSYEFDVQEPSPAAIRAKRVDIEAWEREAKILQRIRHNHIVAFLGAKFAPLPQLRFEYVPGGSLWDCSDISVDEGVMILRQCLSALTYLHGQSPPLVHRDIKPENIYVQYRYAGNICVKMGDFGLSKECPDPTMICGTRRYAAPEIFLEEARRNAQCTVEEESYTPAVDVWSLGVTILECVYGSTPGKAHGISYCEMIVKRLERDLQEKPDNLKQFLWDNMVVMAPTLRGSAQFCHDQALLLSDVGQDRSQTPTPAAPHSHDHQQQYITAYEHGQDQPTTSSMMLGPGQARD